MGDSTCLVRGFSYASAIPNECNQGNLMLALGDSVSFGRFMNETLSWEKRSTFLHKNYVEEAERYARPGSVAQKKAFFEAHYKRIAAKKAAAADVIGQETAAKTEDGEVCKTNADAERGVLPNAHLDVGAVKKESFKIPDRQEDDTVGKSEMNFHNLENQDVEKKTMKLNNLENQDAVPACSGTLKMETASSKLNSAASEDITSVRSKNRSRLSSLGGSVIHKPWNGPSAPAKQVSHLEKQCNGTQGRMKSSADSMDLKESPSEIALTKTPAREPDWEWSSTTTNTENSGSASGSTSTTNSAASPQPKNTRMEKPPVSSTVESKSTSHIWHRLSALFSLSSIRRSAAKNKQKLDEKVKASESRKIQLRKSFKDKAGKTVRKLGCIFCFTDPTMAVERGIPENQGTISMPSPLMHSVKNSSKKSNGIKTSKFPTKSFMERIRCESAPPNIQHRSV